MRFELSELGITLEAREGVRRKKTRGSMDSLHGLVCARKTSDLLYDFCLDS